MTPVGVRNLNAKRKKYLFRSLFLLAVRGREDRCKLQATCPFPLCWCNLPPSAARMGSESLCPSQKKNEAIASFFFSFVPQGTASFAWHTQHHFEQSENIIAAPRGTNERCYGVAVNEVALRANDVLRNDVGLRPMFFLPPPYIFSLQRAFFVLY